MGESARLVSTSLQVVLRREERSRSPVSVQEWVASLPENNNIDAREPRTEDGIKTEADIDGDDNLTLGAEGE